MRTLLAVMTAVALTGLAGSADDKKTDPKPGMAERYKAIQKEYQDANQDLFKQFQATKDAKEKAAIRDKAMAMAPKFADKLIALATEDPKNPEAAEVLLQAFMLARGGPAAAKAADLLATNQASSPKLKEALPMLGSAGEAGRKLLAAVAEKAADRATKGIAKYYMAAGMVEEADQPKPGQTADKQAAALKEAAAALEAVARDYGDVKVGEKTIADEAKGDLYVVNNLTVGKTLPDATVQDLNGKQVKISDYRGKVVVLDIWATWCGPCKAMIPHERELVKRMEEKKQPFVLISLSADAKVETLKNFLTTEPMPWTHWWNGGGQGAALDVYKIRFFPTIFVLDEKGVIRYKHVRGEAMDKAVEELLKDVKPKG